MTPRNQNSPSLGSHLNSSASRSVMALVGIVAAPMLALTASPAQAQSICSETPAGSGIFSCSGASVDSQVLTATGVAADISLDGTVTVDTSASGGSGGNAFTITGNNGVTFTQAAGGGDLTGSVHGIRARNEGAGSLSVTSTGTVTGARYVGISAYNSSAGTDLSIEAVDTNGGYTGIGANNFGSGSLSVTSSGTATGTKFVGIDALNSGAGTDLTVNAVDTNGRDTGIRASNYGTGSLSVTSSGTATGTDYDGINATNSINGTDLTVDAENTNGGRNGIYAKNAGSGSLNVTSSGTATGTNYFGINAINSSAGTDLLVEAEDTSGGRYGIRARNLGSGSLSVTSSGTATGTNYVGIDVFNSSAGADLSVNAEDTSGGNFGIFARNYGTGSLSVTSSGTATGTNYVGIDAFNSSAGTDLLVEAEDTSGGRYGIRAHNLGTGSLSVTSSGTATGGVVGIDAYNSSSGTDLTVNAVDTNGRDTGIRASNYGTGSLSVTSTGTATGAAVGINALNTGAGTNLTVNAADTSGANYGIIARNYGTGSLNVTSNGTATGTNYFGINAYNSSAGTDLTVNAESTNGGRNGIYAKNEGAGSLSVTSTGTATGTNYHGIYAYNSGAGTDLSINAVDTNGGVHGINARNLGSGSLSVTSTGTATGAADGIYATNSSAGTDLTVNAESTNGGRNGIYAKNEGAGSLSVTSTGTATGTIATGIVARNSSAGTDLTVNAEETNGGTIGIDAQNGGSGSLSVISTGTATGGVVGIFAYNSSAGTDLTVNAADTSGANYGILARNEGAGSLSVTSTGTATGTNYAGINAYNSSAGTDLTLNAVDTSGGRYGIGARNFGTGSLSVTSTGTATGGAVGIIATNSSAGTDLSIEASDTSGGYIGIYAQNGGTGALRVTSTGIVNGGVDGIKLGSVGSAIVIENSGTINTGTGYAVITDGGPTSLTNSGTINGRVMLSGLDDTVANSGLFNATASSDFGTGADVFVNTGTVRVSGVVTFAGLERFVNDGLITMVDGAADDSLIISGSYEANSDLAIDVNFTGAGSADTLVIGGTATGHSSIIINDVGVSSEFGQTILVVDAGAGTTADAFTTNSASNTSGFLTYDIFFDAPANDFYLTRTIGTPVFQALKFAEGAQSLWYRSADAVASHMTSRRDASGSPLWMQIYGAKTGRDEGFDFSSSNVAQSIALDYDQDYFGLQMGYDFGPGAEGDGAIFGLTGGYLSSTLGFDGFADRAEYDAYNIGAYAGYKAGALFVDALLKYDFIDASIKAPTPGYTAKLNGKAYGARFQAGYRWDSKGFFVEPAVSIEYQRTSLDDFSALGAKIDYDRFEGLRGMAGFKVGGRSEISGGSTLTYYLGGRAVHEFEGDDGLVFTSGTSSIAIANDPLDTYGRFDLGINIATKSNVSGYIEGNADVGSGYHSYGGRVGLRFRF